MFAVSASNAQSTNNQTQPPTNQAQPSLALSVDNAAAPSVGEFSQLLQRIQFLSADSITHFRYMDSGPGRVTARDEYYKVSTRVQINLVGDGSTYLQARGESGRSFNSSYDYTGMGLHEPYWSYNVKSLYLGQKIGKHLEAQVGGVEFDRGAGTEATSADNDGWLEGYRLNYSSIGHKSLPDRLSVTVGYVGDFTQPNIFSRLNRMGDENYIQALAGKNLGANREASAEFDSIQGIRYTREALRWNKLPVFLQPDFSVEALSRVSDDVRFGWFSSLTRTVTPKMKVRAGAFYSEVPKAMFLKGTSQVLLNGDSYVLGKRIGPTLSVTPVKNLEVSVFGSDRLDNTPGTRYRAQFAVRYQMASLLNRLVR